MVGESRLFAKEVLRGGGVLLDIDLRRRRMVDADPSISTRPKLDYWSIPMLLTDAKSQQVQAMQLLKVGGDV